MLKFDGPASCLITRGLATDDDDASREMVMKAVRLGVKHDVSLIQIREKQLSGRSLFRLVETAVEITRESATKLLVNDRADIAAAAGADGVHVPSDSLPSGVIRKAFPHLLIGCSVHTSDAAEEAAADRADFVIFGPVFPTPGKKASGVAGLEDVCRRLQGFPVIAIGGIDAGNLGEVLTAGAAGIAAIRAMNEPDSLAAIMSALR